MLPDALPQLLDTLLRLPHLEAAQLRRLIQQQPDPQALAREMLRRGWITQDQLSSLFPVPPPRPMPPKTMLVGCADDESPPDADGEDWSLPLGDEEDQADVAPFVVLVQPDRTDQEMLPDAVLLVAGRNEARRRQRDTDKFVRQWMGWASKGLLTGAVLLGSFFAGFQFFWEHSTVPPVAHQEFKQANAGDPAKAVDVPPAIVPVNGAKQQDDLLQDTGQNAQPAMPAAVPPATPVPPPAPLAAKTPIIFNGLQQATDVKLASMAPLYERVRQVVLENKTEETQRLGIGDFAYQHVPDDGSILVGMEVSYVPFFTQHVIKSVRPIYQTPYGTRYAGPVCGKPTGVSERVEARAGYAIGGAAISSGMGINGVQLTFMEIGAEGLNPDKSYLSKWLGGYGGADAKMFVNDGRPIVGIAGMVSKWDFGPAFCMCLVTTPPAALAETTPIRKVK
jgi:hypothetical protein